MGAEGGRLDQQEIVNRNKPPLPAASSKWKQSSLRSIWLTKGESKKKEKKEKRKTPTKLSETIDSSKNTHQNPL